MLLFLEKASRNCAAVRILSGDSPGLRLSLISNMSSGRRNREKGGRACCVIVEHSYFLAKAAISFSFLFS